MKNLSDFLKKKLLLLAMLLLCGSAFAQTYTGLVKWSAEAKKSGDCEYELTFTADIAEHWHIYSQKPFALGPMPTAFAFDKSKNFQLVGKTSEPKGKIDPSWKELENIDVPMFEGKAVFRQKIKLLTDKAFTIKVTIDGQVCEEGRCLNAGAGEPMPVLEVAIPAEACKTADAATNPDTAQTPKSNGGTSSNSADTCPCCPNGVQAAAAATHGGGHSNYNGEEFTWDKKPYDVKLESGCGDDAGEAEDLSSFWMIFIGGFIGGLLALMTPCVFPMIPMTVSFFTKRSKDKKTGIRNAILYASSIVVIYVALGLGITAIFGADALNDMASNVWFNLLFFVVFVIFAISFFGAFEITLPSGFVNKVDRASDRGGLLGIFFMAFTLSLVSFSCTGPIIGTLLVQAAAGSSYLGPAIGMFGFALALALPFAFFAMFPGWLNTLPKSGGWLNSVKIILGFIELALALKFLSNVDLAYHWGFLKRELFLGIWIVIAVLMGVYLLGKLKFSHDSDLPFISIPRLVLSLVCFTLALYMLPGMWGAPVNLFSGYLPPSYYREWKSPSSGDCPHDLMCFHNFDEGMLYAKKHNKPVFVDFTGYSCVNCRKMEDNVWPDPKVMRFLSEDYVVISLYVDDKNPLPQKMHYKNASGEDVKTWGKKWISLERETFGRPSQPWYVLLDNEGKSLAQPRGYTPDADEYARFLEAGLCRYKSRQEAKN